MSRRIPEETPGGTAVAPDPSALKARLDDILNSFPAVGLAVGVVRDGRLELFNAHGLADISSGTPITENTVFRIGSITKTLTAIAIMQLAAQGLVDLDAPADEYLRAYTLTPVSAGWRPATLRHLLTHTSGIPDVLRLGELLHPSWGPIDARPPVHSVEIGAPMPSLAAYFRGRLRTVVEPGSTYAYSNHGFATLGQIVEDVTDEPLDRYYRERIFEPLGMTHTDLVRSDGVRARLATGYVLGSSGSGAVTDREWIGSGAGGVYSSSRDMARYAAALLGGGANEHGSILEPATLGTMFDPHYQPDLRLASMGLGFFRHDGGGHQLVGHDGILPGFNSSLLAAPDSGVGVFAFTNGSKGAMVWLPTAVNAVMGDLLGFAPAVIRHDVPHHPAIWARLCGRYELPAVGDLRGRLMMGRGAQVHVRGGRLAMRLLTPVPALFRSFLLHSDDETDPHVFRLDLGRFGMPSVRLVFADDDGTGATAIHTDLGGQPISLYREAAKSRREPGREPM